MYLADWLTALRQAQPVPADRIPHPRARPYPSQDEFVAYMEKVGIATIERTDYNKMENGKKRISEELVAALVAHFRVDIPVQPSEPVSDQAQLVAAIDRQTAQLANQADAIRELALSVRLAFGRIDANSEERADAISDMLARLEAGLLPADSGGGGERQDDKRQRPVPPRMQKKRPAGGSRPAWAEAPEVASRAS